MDTDKEKRINDVLFKEACVKHRGECQKETIKKDKFERCRVSESAHNIIKNLLI
jgi:hypothetical protein